MARQSQPPAQPPVAATILLTRPEPGASRTAAALRLRLGAAVPILVSPLMAVQFLSPSLPKREFSAVIFTSQTGVAAAVRLREAGGKLPLRAFCVGERTAAAATAAGFVAQAATGNVEALIALIRARSPGPPLLHLRGREVMGDLAIRLETAGLETHAEVVYAQIAQPLTASAEQVLRGNRRVILPLFSPRSARLFHGATRQIEPLAPLEIISLSPAIALAAAPITALYRVTAGEPNEAAMVALMEARLAAPCRDLNRTGPDH